MKHPYTTITVRNSFSSILPAAIVVKNGDETTALDGVTPDMLRGLARVFSQAADLFEMGEDPKASHGPSNISIGYEIEWGDNTGDWPADEDTAR